MQSHSHKENKENKEKKESIVTINNLQVLENVIVLIQIMEPHKLSKWKDKIISILR